MATERSYAFRIIVTSNRDYFTKQPCKLQSINLLKPAGYLMHQQV
jgi:hypothetical protein